MTFQKGDVVLIPFPYTDFSATKTRPALIISDAVYQKHTGNIIVAMITSKPCLTPYDYELKNWRSAKLLTKSWVRMKFATVTPSLIKFKPGNISHDDLNTINMLINKTLCT